MPHDETFQPLPPVGAQLYGYTDNPENVTFYPEVYYHGYCIGLQYWDFESPEPLLRCAAAPSDISELDSDYFQEIINRINPRFASDILKADGWEQVERGVFEKTLHVDELEKIEGPPPEGAF